MNEVRKIIGKCIFLIIDILVLAYQVIKQIILPNRYQKGNILSSTLSLFVGLMESILSFEKSIFRRPFVCRHRYIRQALILAAGFLFLISSVEWTISQSTVSIVNETPAVITNEPAAATVTILSDRHIYAEIPVGNFGTAGYLSDYIPYRVYNPPVIVKRYLRYRILRI